MKENNPTAGLTLVSFLGLFIAGCLDLGSPSRDEVARVASPSGQAEAVLIERNGGATTSFGYQVYLVRRGQQFQKGQQVATLYGAFRNDNAYGVNLRWRDEQTLALEFLGTRSLDISRPVVRIGNNEVRITSHGGVSDPSAPAGGMLYNLSRKSARPLL